MQISIKTLKVLSSESVLFSYASPGKILASVKNESPGRKQIQRRVSPFSNALRHMDTSLEISTLEATVRKVTTLNNHKRMKVYLN